MTQGFVRVEASNYTTIPKVNARSGVALARALLTALPKDAPGAVKHAARQMRRDAVALEDAARAAHAAESSEQTRSRRVIDNEADALHAVVIRRLDDHALLGAHAPAAAQSTAALRAALYPRGSDFLRGDMLSQWQATEEWLAALAVDGREKALRAVVGDGFVDAVRAVHVEYGEAVGTTKPREPAAPRVDVATPLAALAQSTQDLALQLVALANDRSADDAARSAARAALRPIDDHREGNARRGAQRAAAPEPAPAPADGDEPLPEV